MKKKRNLPDLLSEMEKFKDLRFPSPGWIIKGLFFQAHRLPDFRVFFTMKISGNYSRDKAVNAYRNKVLNIQGV